MMDDRWMDGWKEGGKEGGKPLKKFIDLILTSSINNTERIQEKA